MTQLFDLSADEWVFTLRRSGIGSASAELLLARKQASVDALCIKRDKLVSEQRVVPQVLFGPGSTGRSLKAIEEPRLECPAALGPSHQALSNRLL
jgi:hypothetical protein